MPPLKEAKPSEEAANDQRAGVKQRAGPPPPTPPNKPSTSGSLSNLTEISPSMPNSHPPAPPAKDKKPPKTAAELDQQVQDAADEKKEKDRGSETTEAAVETEEVNSDKVEDGKRESAAAKEKVSDEETPEAVSCGIIKTSDNDQQEPAAPQGKSPSPPLISKKSSEDHVPPATQNNNEPSAITQPDAPSVVVSCSDPLTDSLSLLCHLSGEKKKKKAEEKSVDSGQHSDDESEGSGCEDTLAASTAALRGSNVALDVLDASDDSIQLSVHLRPSAELQVRPNAFPCRRSQPFQKPPKPLSKPRSASIGDLLSETSDCSQKQCSRAADTNTPALKDDVTKLEIEVALEMEKTSALLSKAQGESCGEDVPEDLLAKALEKLKKADEVLREVNKLKLTKNTITRMSW